MNIRKSKKKRVESKRKSLGRKRGNSHIAKWCKTKGKMCEKEIVGCVGGTRKKANKSERSKNQGKWSKPMIE